MKTMNLLTNMKKGILLFLFGMAMFGLKAQQMNFSQYQLTPLLNNPSLMALSEEIKADFGYRSQFGGKLGNYSTPYLAAHMPFFVKGRNDVLRKLGAGGLQILTDRTGYNGLFATTGFSLAYAHITALSRTDKISFGLQPGFFQRRVDVAKITTGSQWDSFNGAYDPNRSLNEALATTERRSFFTINAGITYIKENRNGDPLLVLALGGNNLTRPNVSLNNFNFTNPVYWNFQGNILAWENEQFLIRPSFRHIQARNLSQTNLGSYFYYKLQERAGLIKEGNIGLGLWYSNQNALVTALEINQRDWAIGFSYDFLISSLADAQNSTGAPEIIIGFRKFIGRKKKSDINASGTMGGDGGYKKGSKTEEPKKGVSPSEMNPEPVAKPTPADTAKPAPAPVEKPVAPAEPAPKVEEQPAAPATPATPVKTTEPKAGTTKPVVPAKKNTKAPAKKVTTKKPAVKAKVRPQSNLTEEQKEKLRDVVTPDEYLGNDPYKGTQKALNANQKALLKKQPRFGFNGYEMDQETADQLKELAAIMKSRPKMKLEIGGFGCDKGGPEVTKMVALGRAESVRRYLLSQGVPANQVTAKSYGMENPVQANDSEVGQVANRRVQFKFIK
jgi:type IX secretion system PorP/SprF family membrane protein